MATLVFAEPLESFLKEKKLKGRFIELLKIFKSKKYMEALTRVTGPNVLNRAFIWRKTIEGEEKWLSISQEYMVYYEDYSEN